MQLSTSCRLNAKILCGYFILIIGFLGLKLFWISDALATECSDNDAAQHLNEARAELFQLINKSQQSVA